MKDRPWASMARMFASQIIPESATMVTSSRPWAAMNFLRVGTMVVLSALLPSKALTLSGNPGASVSRPMVICGSRRRLRVR